MATMTQAPPATTNKHLIRWVEKMADLCQPAAIHWIDGSQEEYERLCDQLVGAGTFFPLNEKKVRLLLRPSYRSGYGAAGVSNWKLGSMNDRGILRAG